MVQATEAPGRRWNSPPILLTLGARTVAPEDTAAASAAEPNRGEYDAAVRMSLPTDWSALPSVGTADSPSGAPRGRLGRPSLNERVLSVGSSGWGVAEVSAWLVVVRSGCVKAWGKLLGAGVAATVLAGCASTSGSKSAPAVASVAPLTSPTSVAPESSVPRNPLRVTISGGCPSTVAGFDDVENPDPSLKARLLPDATPTAGLICLYGPLMGPAPGRPPRVVHLSEADAGKLAAAMSAVRTGSPCPGPQNCAIVCPNDNESFDIIVFAYDGRPDADVWYHASGCRDLENGHISASEDSNPPFYNGFDSEFSALTGAS